MSESLNAHRYAFVYDRIRADLESVMDYRDEWRSLTRAELIDKVMIRHRAGLDPHISNAVVEAGRALLEEQRARIAELEAQLNGGA